ncbi:cytochrome c-type biogenesis protein CcmF, partial [mine drainage metagenome]
MAPPARGAVASADLIHAFLVHDFALSYVADNNARQTPLLYDISGMWSALQGSILLWGLILAGYVAFFSWRLRRFGDDARSAWALVVAYGTAAFFFG